MTRQPPQPPSDWPALMQGLVRHLENLERDGVCWLNLGRDEALEALLAEAESLPVIHEGLTELAQHRTREGPGQPGGEMTSHGDQARPSRPHTPGHGPAEIREALRAGSAPPRSESVAGSGAQPLSQPKPAERAEITQDTAPEPQAPGHEHAEAPPPDSAGPHPAEPLPGSPLPEPSRPASPAPAGPPPHPSTLATLESLRFQFRDCQGCGLAPTRNRLVFGTGSPRPRLMFIGEGPGADEDEQGLPFVGRAGRLLTGLIQAMGLLREDVYITNVVKCRPPGNRNPEPEETAACRPILERQIELLAPALIVTLGNVPLKLLKPQAAGITRERGHVFDYRGFAVLPTFHPSYLLRNPAAIETCWQDFRQALERGYPAG